ncbi:hypothetical protein CR513_13448, partial [Mucuna pruriens]
MVITYRDWNEMLPFALHEYQTMVYTSMGATTYSLVYGMETALPIEVEIPSIRVLAKAKLEETKWVQACYDQLNRIEEKKIGFPLSWSILSTPRDLVLKKILPSQKDHRGKWTPNYEGPYEVKRAFSKRAMILTNMDGKDLLHPENSDAVKKIYP